MPSARAVASSGVPAGAAFAIYDVWAGKSRGTATGFRASVGAHDTVLLIVTPA